MKKEVYKGIFWIKDLENVFNNDTIFLISCDENGNIKDTVSVGTTLLLGDLTKIVIKKLNKDTFIMYGDVIDNYQDQIDVKFHINEDLLDEE